MVNSRTWLCTYYPKETEEIIWEDVFGRTKDIKAMAGQMEVCPTTNRRHWQFVCKFKNATSEEQPGKRTGLTGTHSEPLVYGKEDNLRKYVHKDRTSVPGTRFEFGEFGEGQGERTDLKLIKDDIMNGKELDDLTLENPTLYHKYGRTLEKIESIRFSRNRRTEMTKGLWLYGLTGVGKSKLAFEYDLNAYTWVNNSRFQCGYKQQDVVIINEFRGEITLGELLNMVDGWTYKVERKGKEAIPFTSKLVIITSSKPPCEIFQHALSDTERIDQVYRRFKIHEVLKNNTATVGEILSS